MADISPRRRFAGRALLAGAALALPLTASIGYAETGAAQVSQPPVVPETPEVAPLAPPVPPAVTHPIARVIERDVDVQVDGELDRGDGDPAAQTEEAVRSVRSRVLRIERRVDGAAGEAPNSLRVLRMKDGRLTAEERARLQEDMAELREELGEGGALAQSLARARTAMPDIVHSCQTGQAEVIVSGKTAAGREALFYCHRAAMESARVAMLGARSAIRGARAAVEGARWAIQADRSLSDAERTEALRSIEEALAGLASDG